MKELLNHVRLNEILKVGIRNKETKLGDLVGLRSEEMKRKHKNDVVQHKIRVRDIFTPTKGNACLLFFRAEFYVQYLNIDLISLPNDASTAPSCLAPPI